MNASLEVLVGNALRAAGLTLAIAESCTGGLVGHRLTNIPGSSEYYLGGVTAYAYEAKVKLLGVKWDTLNQFGAVSDETVAEMAAGIRRILGSDLGLSISGIAGPGGGMPSKPVGLVYFGLSRSESVITEHHQFDGDRESVKAQAANLAMQLLLNSLGRKNESN